MWCVVTCIIIILCVLYYYAGGTGAAYCGHNLDAGPILSLTLVTHP